MKRSNGIQILQVEISLGVHGCSNSVSLENPHNYSGSTVVFTLVHIPLSPYMSACGSTTSGENDDTSEDFIFSLHFVSHFCIALKVTICSEGTVCNGFASRKVLDIVLCMILLAYFDTEEMPNKENQNTEEK